MLNLDTHVLLFALAGQLTARERSVLATHPWGISAIVIWEIAKLSQLGRIELDLDDPEVGRAISALHIWPIDLAVCRQIGKLDFKGDPADELIAATSIVHGIPLVTRDRVIRKSKLVALA